MTLVPIGSHLRFDNVGSSPSGGVSCYLVWQKPIGVISPYKVTWNTAVVQVPAQATRHAPTTPDNAVTFRDFACHTEVTLRIAAPNNFTTGIQSHGAV